MAYADRYPKRGNLWNAGQHSAHLAGPDGAGLNLRRSVAKNTRVGGIHEDSVLQFRAEFFNIFNHPQFSNPASDFANGNFGQITSTSVNPRLIQFARKYIF